jgi:glutaryl-CoA dehydrogenase (non-decarboxylating)
MLSFELTDEQRLLEGTVREWAAREVAPRIDALDRAHQFDRGIFPQMADLGLRGISVPVEYGGAGMDYLCLGLASEELEYVDRHLRGHSRDTQTDAGRLCARVPDGQAGALRAAGRGA